MTTDGPATLGPRGTSVDQEVVGVAALIAAAADFEESCRYPSIPQGAAARLLDRLVAADRNAAAARKRLEELRVAAGVESDHSVWPVDVVEAVWALEEMLGRPEAEVVEIFGEHTYPWEYLLGLAEERISRRSGDVAALERVAQRLRALAADENPL